MEALCPENEEQRFRMSAEGFGKMLLEEVKEETLDEVLPNSISQSFKLMRNSFCRPYAPPSHQHLHQLVF